MSKALMSSSPCGPDAWAKLICAVGAGFLLTMAWLCVAAGNGSASATSPTVSASYAYDTALKTPGSTFRTGLDRADSQAGTDSRFVASAGEASAVRPVFVAADTADAGDSVGATCGGESFTPDTNVVMADGSTRPLDQVKVAEKVEAAEPKTGKTTAETVLKGKLGSINRAPLPCGTPPCHRSAT